ncbi:MAG TPA: GAF domain-containing protein, partial [Candidatus Binatia bacterium]|nr:GAF domain-containing protein [Candidatus Binatia bacterium]
MQTGSQQERDLRRVVRELEFLQRLSQSAASTRDSEELLQLLIHETTSALGTDVCSLYLISPDGKELTLTATNGLNERMVGRVSMPVGEGITGSVADTREPKLVSEVALDPHWKWVPGLDEERFHSMLSVPIESGPRLVGVLNVQSVELREFSQGDVDSLRAIAGQVAGILERSELQRRLEAQLAEIRFSHDIHERFTRLSLDGAGIPAILEAVGVLAGGRAALYSPSGFRVRGAGQSAEELPSRLQIPPAVLAAGARELRAAAGRRQVPVDLAPVRAGDDVLGVLAVLVPDRATDEEGRRRALEHGSTVLALELSKERAAAEVERRLRGDLVEEVLAGG